MAGQLPAAETDPERIEYFALATVGGETGLAVSVGLDPAEQKGRYLVVFTPAAPIKIIQIPM